MGLYGSKLAASGPHAGVIRVNLGSAESRINYLFGAGSDLRKVQKSVGSGPDFVNYSVDTQTGLQSILAGPQQLEIPAGRDGDLPRLREVVQSMTNNLKTQLAAGEITSLVEAGYEVEIHPGVDQVAYKARSDEKLLIKVTGTEPNQVSFKLNLATEQLSLIQGESLLPAGRDGNLEALKLAFNGLIADLEKFLAPPPTPAAEPVVPAAASAEVVASPEAVAAEPVAATSTA